MQIKMLAHHRLAFRLRKKYVAFVRLKFPSIQEYLFYFGVYIFEVFKTLLRCFKMYIYLLLFIYFLIFIFIYLYLFIYSNRQWPFLIRCGVCLSMASVFLKYCFYTTFKILRVGDCSHLFNVCNAWCTLYSNYLNNSERACGKWDRMLCFNILPASFVKCVIYLWLPFRSFNWTGLVFLQQYVNDCKKMYNNQVFSDSNPAKDKSSLYGR